MKKLALLLGALALSLGAAAQTLLGGAEFSMKLPASLSAGAEVEYRTMNWFDHTEQWSIAADLGYKPLKCLKLGVQYKFIQAHNLAGRTNGGYDYNAYWDNKHRVSLSATGSLKVWKFSLSLRERYQYTYRPSHEIPRFDDGEPAGNRTIDAKSKHILRSRAQVEFKAYKKCPWTPYASFELYSLLKEVNHTDADKATDPAKFCDKFRVTAGCEYKINKHNGLDLFYRFASNNDYEELDMSHTIGLVYSFSL